MLCFFKIQLVIVGNATYIVTQKQNTLWSTIQTVQFIITFFTGKRYRQTHRPGSLNDSNHLLLKSKLTSGEGERNGYIEHPDVVAKCLGAFRNDDGYKGKERGDETEDHHGLRRFEPG